MGKVRSCGRLGLQTVDFADSTESTGSGTMEEGVDILELRRRERKRISLNSLERSERVSACRRWTLLYPQEDLARDRSRSGRWRESSIGRSSSSSLARSTSSWPPRDSRPCPYFATWATPSAHTPPWTTFRLHFFNDINPNVCVSVFVDFVISEGAFRLGQRPRLLPTILSLVPELSLTPEQHFQGRATPV